MCKFLAKNNNPSILFDTVAKQYNESTALRYYIVTRSANFENWFGKGKVDKNGEPKLVGKSYFVNESNERWYIEQENTSSIVDDKFVQKASVLSNIFKQHGATVSVEVDTTIDGAGLTIGTSDGAKIVFNPNKIKKDTVFHEFGHVYIDLIGENSNIVKSGIDQLRGSELWDQVERMRPDLHGIQLEKEVLTTAIGIAAQNIHDERAKIVALKHGTLLNKLESFVRWFKLFAREIAAKLNINQSAAERLAFDLTGGRLKSIADGKVSTYAQYQRVSVEDITSVISNRLELDTDGKKYRLKSDPNTKFDRVTNFLEILTGAFNRQAAIAAAARSNSPLNEDYVEAEQIERLWADTREEGSGVHKIMEDYVRNRNAGKTSEESKAYILKNLYKPENQVPFDDDGVRVYSGLKEKHVGKYIDKLVKFIDNLLDQGYTLYPEIKIFHPSISVAGTIDLLAVDKDGNVHIYDYKLKRRVIKDGQQHTKFDEWNTINLKEATFIPTQFAHLYNTYNNRYSVQTSMYKLMLAAYGIEVKTMNIVPLVGDIVEENGEFSFENVEFYSGATSSSFSNGVFVLEDYAELINKILYGKDSLEELINDSERAKEFAAESLTSLAQIDGIADWVKDIVYDIHRTITRLWNTGLRERAEAYERTAKSLISKLMVTDEVEAINAYTKYIGETLLGLHQKLYGKVIITAKNKSGEVTGSKYVEGYAKLTWKDIKEMEETDPQEYMKFTAFLINASHFVNQVAKIGDINFSALIDLNNLTEEEKVLFMETQQDIAVALENANPEQKLNIYYNFISSIKGQYSETLALLKSFEGKISDIRVTLNKLRAENNHRYIELSSNPLFEGKDTTEVFEQFFAATKDETFMQRNMDAMADTHVPFIANVIKRYDHMLFEQKQETSKILEEFFELTKDVNLDPLVDRETGKLVQKVDRQKFLEARKAMFNEAFSTFDSRSAKNYVEKKAIDRQRAAFINKWFKENTDQLSNEAIKKITTQKKNTLSKEDFAKWLNNQYYFNSKRERFIKNTSVFRVPKEDIYADDVYKSLDEKQKAALDYLSNLFLYLVDHVKGNMIANGYIPAIPVDSDSVWDVIKKQFDFSYDKKIEIVDVDEDGNIINTLPMHFTRYLGTKEYVKVPVGASEDVRKDIYKQNEEIRKENDKIHAASINTNLKAVVPIFVDHALRHKYKKHMEFELLSVAQSFAETGKISTTRGGKVLLDKVKVKLGEANPEVVKSASDSKVLGHYKDWLKMVFYEEDQIDEGVLTKVARILQNYTSFRGLALNPLSAINNQAYGEMMSHVEGIGGEYFSTRDWNFASRVYTSAIFSFYSQNENTEEFDSKAAALLHFYGDVFMDYKELAHSAYETDKNVGSAYKLGRLLGKLYFMQHASEHTLQGRLIIAMSHSHKIVDGKIMSFHDFLRGKLKTYDPYKIDNAAAKQIIEENKGLTRKAKEEWNSYKTFWDSFDLVDNKFKFNEGVKVDDVEVADFQRRMLGVNQYIHGVYNREDAGALQQYALGRLALQFRKWMRPGWNKRFGARAFEEYWNERRSTQEEGYYSTAIKFMASPIFHHFKQMKESEDYRNETTIAKGLANILKDYKKLIFNLNIHWHSLTNTQRSNILRTLTEYAMFSMLIGIYYALKSLKGDDDEPPAALMLALYQTDRSITELTQYVPVAFTVGYAGGGWMNEMKKILKTPTATFNVIENMFTFSKQLMMYPFESAEERVYQTGIYHGEDKLKVATIKLIPLINHMNRIANLDRNYKYYKLF